MCRKRVILGSTPEVPAEEEPMKFRVVLEPSEERGFTAVVPSLPGCISEGDTREEALANVRGNCSLHGTGRR